VLLAARYLLAASNEQVANSKKHVGFIVGLPNTPSGLHLTTRDKTHSEPLEN
jgi:hypothetical protein